MATAWENFQIQDLVARPEDAARLAVLATADGQRVRGYSGDYFRYWLGDAAVIVRMGQNYDTGEAELWGMDSHAASDCLWDCQMVDDLTPDSYDQMARRLLVTNAAGALAVVELVNADVLPAFRPGMPLRLNMVGFPRWIHYGKDQKDYEESLEKCESGETVSLPLGGVFPLDYTRENRMDDAAQKESLVLLRGRVKDARVGETYMGLEPMTTFVRVTVGTDLGDLELCHAAEQVAEEEKDLVRPGAEVSALCLLSGDAAVGELAGGVVFREDQDLELLRTFFEEGGADRLRPALNSQCVCVSDSTCQEIAGVEETVAMLKGVEAELDGNNCYFTYPAVITGVEAAEGETRPDYGKGKRCLLLAQGGPERYVALCFVETDSLGRIQKIHLNGDGRYSFARLDLPEEQG